MPRPPRPFVERFAGAAVLWIAVHGFVRAADLTTWDGRHSIDRIDVTVVYYVPADRRPLADWRDRVRYLCDRIRRFHDREFEGLSRLSVAIHPEPFISSLSTAALRQGDADAIFFRTLRETDARLAFGRRNGGGFPVLLVLSDVNWRPLDDFARQVPTPDGWRFEGSLAEDGGHVPGAAAGGSRATYLADAGKGWGLVSADGWRVPMRGSDCVVYHEGVGHAIGLPHPEPADGSVMSLGQYRGWIGESWVNESQKRRLGWEIVAPTRPATDPMARCRALPETTVPGPGDEVAIRLEWPDGMTVREAKVCFQTSLRGPWILSPTPPDEMLRTRRAVLGRFDQAASIAYRVRLRLAAGDPSTSTTTTPATPPGPATPRDDATWEELWGYLQVRADADRPPEPTDPDATDTLPWRETSAAVDPKAIELLPLIDPEQHAVVGQWQRRGESPQGLVAPRAFGARIEIPELPPAAYRLTIVAEPLDEPGALTIGLRSATGRFLVLLGFRQRGTDDRDGIVSALENVDGGNVDINPTRRVGSLFVKDRPATIICSVKPVRNVLTAGREQPTAPVAVEVEVDGHDVITWQGDASRLELADYWKTPDERRLFLGAYDCRWLFRRVTLEPIDP